MPCGKLNSFFKGLALILAVNLSGCAVDQGLKNVTEKPSERTEEKTKRDELEARIVSSPMLITAEYFREKQTSNPENKINFFPISKDPDKQLEERIKLLEKKLAYHAERPKELGGILLKRKVVILSLLGDTGLDVLAMLPTSLKKTKGILPIDSNEFLIYLEKNGLKPEDLASQKTRKEIAHRLGIHAYILIYFQPNETIAINENKNKLRIDVINANDNTLISSYFTTVNEFDTLSHNISDDVVRSTQWSSRVVHTEDKKIFINAGALSGIYPDDTFDIYSQGKEIIDPLTGRLLGTLPGDYKGTIKIETLFGSDGSIGNLISGGNINIGDIVLIPSLTKN